MANSSSFIISTEQTHNRDHRDTWHLSLSCSIVCALLGRCDLEWACAEIECVAPCHGILGKVATAANC